MGVINQGILGGFSGKVGNVVGGNWKGIDYMRVKPANVANPRTEGQVNQRTKFTAALQFLQPMKDFIKVGYKGYAVKKTEFNSAMSYLLKNAITGVAPDFEIDYPAALISRGSLTGSLNAALDVATAGSAGFSWDDNAGSGNALASDKAMLLIYNESKGEVIFTTAGAARSVGAQNLVLPDEYSGDTVRAYIAFVKEDGTEVSNSTYIGSAVVA
ncbi:MAG: DUF6266 family protein [Cyclobacteriaceae bacterium]